MVPVSSLAQKSRRPVGTMNPRSQALFLVMVAAFLVGVGFIAGWDARKLTADHRFITAFIARMVAEESYYNRKLDMQIQENERIYRNDRTKKN